MDTIVEPGGANAVVVAPMTDVLLDQVASVARSSICLPLFGSKDTLHLGDSMFNEQMSRLFQPIENNALESIVTLKQRATGMLNDEFFAYVTEVIAVILGADMSFVMKRILMDEQNAAIEMPAFGDPGSCMMAAAFHYTKDDGSKHTLKQCKFHAYSCPCSFMRHDKVFIIPEKFGEFITENPNTLPMPAEAYISLPIFVDEKCIGHFGCMWSPTAAAKRTMSWAFIEMLLHSLEDMIAEKLVLGADFVPETSALRKHKQVIPADAVSAAQSLRPYAGSLSHELRTPMQGVVGMLDVMYATVQEAVESLDDPKLRGVFASLKDSIEVVQDSSRRAVEAADNVVHAYDMNMSIPERPAALQRLDSNESVPTLSAPSALKSSDGMPEILVSGSHLPLSGTNKRRRDEDFSPQDNSAGVAKIQKLEDVTSVWSRTTELPTNGEVTPEPESDTQISAKAGDELGEFPQSTTTATSWSSHTSRAIAPGLRHTSMRETLKHVIDEGLKLGGRPDTILALENAYGECIEVRSRGSDGTVSSKTIDWSVDPSVPETMYVDEKDLSKLVSCIFLNALKFADQQDGRIDIKAQLSSRNRYIVITIKDNGPGIPSAFLPQLFKPFSQENRSITRQSDGLGLGLLVAKGIARKLGGDVSILKAETEGAGHGSEFEIKLPLVDGEAVTRPSSPFSSPRPRASTLSALEIPQLPLVTATPSELASPIRLNTDLHDVPLYCADVVNSPSTSPTYNSRKKLGIPSAVAHVTSYPTSPPLSAADGTPKQPRVRNSVASLKLDRELSKKYPLTFLVAEDNKINRRLLVNMLSKLGYKSVSEAHDGAEAVRQMSLARRKGHRIDVILMDLWMPLMDGYEATEQILHGLDVQYDKPPTVLAVTADVTDGALERAAQVGMTGFMTKPYKMLDLQRLITESCVRSSIIQVDA